MLRVIEWTGQAVVLIDQRRLPLSEEYVSCEDVESVARAIEDMVVRGAPAIGVTAAMGLALAATRSGAATTAELAADIETASARLLETRPTAVNLRWALRRIGDLVARMAAAEPDAVREAVVAEAREIHADDIAINQAIGGHGAELLGDGGVLTHCNAGALATAGYGTALGVIRAATEAGMRITVYADETRPFLQGARLTAWELQRDSIPVTVITDGMAGPVLRSGRVQAVVVGADRIAANGDVANKIGTYGVAVLADANQVPFYVAAPLSTIDLETATGDDIPIEERRKEEITCLGGVQVVPDGVDVYNPAFDITPARYVDGVVTERGIARAPFEQSLAKLFAE